MPEDMAFRPDDTLLTAGEIERVAASFSRLGGRKIRFTGGEPTLRSDLVPLVAAVADLPGIETVAMTTNAIRLKSLAAPLARAGIKRINVSFDTLDPAKFKQITRWGNIDDTWAGIEAAEREGIEIKLNAVVMRGLNDDRDVIELAGLTRDHAWQVRFIEMMPFGEVAEFQHTFMVGEAALRKRLANAFGDLQTVNGGKLDGEARLFRIPDARGTIGFISSVTQPFCAECNRVRLTADGKLRLCLLRDSEIDLRGPLREGADDQVLDAALARAIHHKPWGHGLAEQIQPRTREMSEIGG